MAVASVYSLDAEIANFFSKTSITRLVCDAQANELAGGRVVPSEIQGACSYTVYAGPNLEYVVQFRLKSLEVKTETITLARGIYGSLVPEVSFKGQIGDGGDQKDHLYVYLMSRVRGVTHLEFILAYGFPENSPENFARRETLMTDVARYVRSCWILTSLELSIIASSPSPGKHPSRLVRPTATTWVKHTSGSYRFCSMLCQAASILSSRVAFTPWVLFSLCLWFSCTEILAPAI
jgi:hypothetical protein